MDQLSTEVLGPLVGFANELANAAGDVQRRWYRQGFDIETKGDESPVTVADLETEKLLRELILSRYSDHGIIGEEFDAAVGNSEFQWVIDPIDGTRSFVVGRPLFGTLISLLHQGRPVIGIVDQSIVRDRWVGTAGEPTTLNGKPISTRCCKQLSDAIMLCTSPDLFKGESEVSALDDLRAASKDIVYGGDSIGYGQLAAGFADIVFETELKVFDFMALVPVVIGAGGSITDWNGDELGPECAGDVLALGDPTLLDHVLPLVSGRQRPSK